MYRVAVIDDEVIVVKGIEAILKKTGNDCMIVGAGNTAQEGLTMLRERKPDIVFTDIRMPGMDGLTLIEEALKILPDAHFIVISGYSDFAYAKKAIQLGVIDYIEKPVTVEKVKQLFELVEHRKKLESKKEEEKPENTLTRHRTIEKTLAYMDMHFNEDISLGDVAQEMTMSQGYLSSLFKEEMGISFVKYLTKLRVEKAKILLDEGYKVSDVSKMVGYIEYRYFCEVFKKMTGMTPNEYRGSVRTGAFVPVDDKSSSY